MSERARGHIPWPRGRGAALAGASLAAAAAVVAIGAALGVTFGAFAGATSNDGNSFQAAASFGSTLRMASGNYAGDGVDNRSISVGFQPDLVIVKGDNSQVAVARTSTITGDNSKPLSGGANFTSNLIQSLDAGGFTLGTNTRVNQNGTSYYWVAFKAAAGVFQVGTYTGTGASQGVTGVGFSPDYVAVIEQGASAALQRFAGMTTSFRFEAHKGTASAINSLDADGFTVGTSADANKSATTYHYVAFNDVAGTIKTASHTGTGASTSVTGVGFQPDYVLIRADDTATARQGVHRPASLTGTGSLLFESTANITTGITSLQSDGFGLGTSGDVNASGVAYHYLAVKNMGGGCSLPGTQTVTASADSWVDQSSPDSSAGGNASALRVTSKSPSQNARALVQFNLPALPSGCSVTQAKLRLDNNAPSATRTIEALQNAASWTETGVTWNNQPATTGSAATATTPAAAGWMEWTVTSQVQAMYTGSNNGFKLRDASEDAAGGFTQQFNSREAGANPPELVITSG